MANQRLIMKKISITTIFILGILIASCNDVEEGGKEGWDYDTIIIDSSCSMYIEYPTKEKYLSNISAMGVCPTFKPKNYLEGYKSLLEKYAMKLNNKSGIITFQTPFEIKSDTGFTQSLIETTSNFFSADVKVIKEEKSVFIVDVIPKK